MKNLKIAFITFVFCLVSSCGFINDAPVKDQDIFVSNELSSSCKLDPDQFGNIFDLNIEAQIKCLEDNFNQFSRYVRSGDRDTISESELSNFVRRFFKNNSDTIIQGLKLIFELNMLLLKDEATTISRDNISPLFRLLLTVNKQAIIITKALKEMQDEKDGKRAFEKRKALMKALQDFTDSSLEIINRPGNEIKSVNLKEFLLGLNDRIDLGKNPIDDKLAEAILFIKKIFLGGDKFILTSKEIEYAIVKLPKLVVMATDLTFIRKEHFKNQKTYIGFQQNILKRFENIIHPAQDLDIIFKIEDLFVIFDRVSGNDSDFNLRDYEKVFKSVKKDLIGGSETSFNFVEFNHLLTYLNISLEGLKFHEDHKSLTKEIELLTLEEKVIIKKKYLHEIEIRVERIKSILSKKQQLPSRINILNFAKTLSSEIDGFDFDIDFLDAVFGIKVLIAGGTKEQLTEAQLYKTLDKIQGLAATYFDLAYLNDSYQKDSSWKWHFLKKVVENLSSLIEEDDSLKSMTMNDLRIILKELFSPESIENSNEHKELGGISLEESDIDAILRTLKEEVFISTPEVITVGEIRALLNITEISMSALELLQSYNEKSVIAKQDPSAVNIFTEELEEKAELFNITVQAVLPRVNYINKNLDYLKILEGLRPIIVDQEKNEADIVDYIENLRPLKTLLFGGTRDVLSFSEIKTLATKIPSYISSVFKLLHTDTSNEADTIKQSSLNLEIFSNIKKNLILDTQTSYFNGYELMESLNWFMNQSSSDDSSPIDYKKFASTVLKFKGRVLHQIKNPKVDPSKIPAVSEFNSGHIHSILEWMHEGLENLYYTEKTYKYFEKELSSPKQISYLNLYRNSDYPLVRDGSMSSLRREFLYMVKKHRHFTKKIIREDENGQSTKFIQFFGKDIQRDQYGFTQLALIRFALKKAMLGYSIKVNGKDAVDVDRINMLLFDFKPVLEEFNLWTKSIETFGENTILLGDLFQNASDGDNAINVDEGAEYASMIIVAVTLADELMHKVNNHCANQGTEEDLLFYPRCYRPHFFNAWLNDLEYGKYFPKLNSYFKYSPKDESTDFIRKTEGFARDVDDEKVPMGIRDFTLVVGALLNIESTFVRFDLNNDNVIDMQELDKAFLIYEGSIVKIAELYGWKKMFTKTVFLYMIKNMRIPTEGQVMKYHFNLNFNPLYNEDIKAKRLNIGALLYNLIQYRSGE